MNALKRKKKKEKKKVSLWQKAIDDCVQHMFYMYIYVCEPVHFRILYVKCLGGKKIQQYKNDNIR